MFETILDANFLNMHIDKAAKTHDEKQLNLITHFTKQTLNLDYLLLTLNVTVQLLTTQNRKGHSLSKFNSPGHNQNWKYSDVIELHKMASTLRDAIRGHISALFSALECSFPTVLWEPSFE